MSNISDHFLYIHTVTFHNPEVKHSKKMLYYCKVTSNSLNILFSEIAKLDIYQSLNTDMNTDLNINYNILEKPIFNTLNM